MELAKAIFFNQFRYLKYHLVQPLVQQSTTGEDKVSRSVDLLTDYDLQKTDFDTICEMTQFPGRNNLMSKVFDLYSSI